MKKFFSFVFLLGFLPAMAQPGYWQQHVNYTIDAELNHQNHQIKGKEKLVYTNNSPDTLTKIYFHLYWNAFRPGSMMDVRSRNIEDPDPRVGARIAALKPNEIGIQKVVSMTQDGKTVNLSERETVLEVTLAKPLAPGKKTTLALDFEAQVPVQIR
ncbi:MAG: M1 family peptidase, partial [Bacteroidia bacterium]